MPSSSSSRHRRSQILARRALTLEQHERAAVDFARYGVLPSTRPSLYGRCQRELEHYILANLGRGDLAAATEWPDGTVLGIRSVTPRPDSLLLDLHPDALLPVLHSLLPLTRYLDAAARGRAIHVWPNGTRSVTTGWFYSDLVDEVAGVPCLRATPTKAGLALAMLDEDAEAPGRVLLRGITAELWSGLAAELLGTYTDRDDPEWHHQPDRIAPNEHWHRFHTGQELARTRSAVRGSGILRRIGLLQGRDVRAIAVDPGRDLATGTIFDAPGWPARRPGQIAVRLAPGSSGGPGPLLWLPTAPDDGAMPETIPLESGTARPRPSKDQTVRPR
ncbi:hypothetical protein CU254_42050 (plasmid) [Amycolatopsis sp. AA4]|uniref:hypothetical protein n=1 Tax=Actinomycetes TaxID=1760 RepID=UPI0001B56C0B|nr:MULTISPECIES: hypothetical protein [Actinomycetes]ATY17163.1 hypothetical protein CU254_42050 [Amycolatopsis sp. AA4]